MKKILGCKTFAIRDNNEIESKLNPCFLENKDMKIRFITQAYIPTDRTHVKKEGKYEEIQGYHLYTIFFESISFNTH
ncbi:MAG TPA: hypothetical protein ENI29_15970 [bacterium]|nr:hypothetical protein [bacterium]